MFFMTDDSLREYNLIRETGELVRQKTRLVGTTFISDEATCYRAQDVLGQAYRVLNFAQKVIEYTGQSIDIRNLSSKTELLEWKVAIGCSS